jgi:hypothetical protein
LPAERIFTQQFRRFAVQSTFSLRMKLFCLTLIFVFAGNWALRAQETDSQSAPPPPPVEIPDFSNLDEYVYQPKSNLNFGLRYVTGIKAKFSGNGYIAAPEDLPNATAANISRTYHDGDVQPNSRALTINNGDGTGSSLGLPSDGKTDTWDYSSLSQVTSDDYMQFNIYSAQTLNSNSFSVNGKGSMGMELSSARDMGNLSKKFAWRLFTGFSLNDILASSNANVTSKITTITDTYDLYGAAAPNPPGSSQSGLTTVLLSDAPVGNRAVTTSIDSVSATDQFKVHGAYAYFRGGPMLVYTPMDHFHLNLSVGPALAYAGSSFQATEILNTPTGGQIADILASVESKVVLGYFIDAQLQYDVNERTGFYIGGFFQNGGSYIQSVSGNGAGTNGVVSTLAVTNSFGTPTGGTTTVVTGDPMVIPNSNSATAGTIFGSYQTRIDFSDQEGFRAGMTYKF